MSDTTYIYERNENRQSRFAGRLPPRQDITIDDPQHYPIIYDGLTDYGEDSRIAELEEYIEYGEYAASGTEYSNDIVEIWQGFITPNKSSLKAAVNLSSASNTEYENTTLSYYVSAKSSSRNPSKTVDILKALRHGVISPMGHPIEAITPRSESAGLIKTVSIGFDAEWVVAPNQRRIVLSYQFAVAVDGLDGVWFVVIYKPQGGRRFTISRMLSHFLRVADISGVLPGRLPAFRKYKATNELTFVGKTAKKAKSGAKALVRKKASNHPNKHGNRVHDQILSVVLCGHNTIVDLTASEDGNRQLSCTDTIRKSSVTVERPMMITINDHNRNSLRCSVILRDSMMLSGANAKLADLGDSLGLPKVCIPESYAKDRMDLLSAGRPDAFLIYSAVDPVIALEWVMHWQRLAEQELVHEQRGHFVVPPTVGSISAKIVRQKISRARGLENREAFDAYFRGMETIEKVDPDASGKLRRRKETVLGPFAAMTDTPFREAFLGGRNECFAFGPWPATGGRVWHDWDFKNAYVAAMALIADIDWTRQPIVRQSGSLLRGEIAAFACWVGLIDFRFPLETVFPCLPIRDKHGRGLIFPLAGEKVWATASEVWLALELGAEIMVHISYEHPRRGVYSLREPVTFFLAQRAKAKAEYGKGSPYERSWKDLSNASYGKSGQGLRDKRAYSPRYDASNIVPPSEITSAPLAAMITALVRALVSACLNELSDLGYRVLSVTTDGFLVDADASVIHSLTGCGLIDAFKEARLLVASEDDDGEIVECKHSAEIMVMAKTRAAFGMGAVHGSPLPLAAAGYSQSEADREMSAGGEMMSEIVAKKFLNRDRDFETRFKVLPSAKDYVRRSADGVAKEIRRKVNWEFDHKRQIALETVRDVVIGNLVHVAYYTTPHRDMASFEAARADVEGRSEREIFRTAEHVRDFVSRLNSKQVFNEVGARRAAAKNGGIRRTVAVNILRAIRQDLIKIKSTHSGVGIIKIVGDSLDVKLSENDWKNARRSGTSHKAKSVLTANFTPVLCALARQLELEDWVIWATEEDRIQYERNVAR